MIRITWEQALAWRMQRHLLDPVGDLSVPQVVGRLCGVQTQVASSAELAIRVRRTTSRSGEVGRALAQGRLVKTWAMRGTLHLLRPEDAGAYLALIAAGRPWARPSWQRYFGVDDEQLELLRRTASAALAGTVLTREELIEAIVAQRGLAHLGEELRSGWGTLLKPLAWQGDLCFGPSRGNRATFMRPEDASSRWAGLPEPDDAARTAIISYVGAYGPTTVDAFSHWLAGGYFAKRRLRDWFASLADRLVEIEVDGERAHVLAEHADELAATTPSATVRLLPGFDQYVLGPGTGDGHVTPSARRGEVSRQSGWISPVVLRGGRVCGTWAIDGNHAAIAWFREAGRAPRRALREEGAQIAAILGRELETSVEIG